jgi:hypothetical protein
MSVLRNGDFILDILDCEYEGSGTWSTRTTPPRSSTPSPTKLTSVQQGVAELHKRMLEAKPGEAFPATPDTFRYVLLFEDALARQQGLNLDGSPRRETFDA